MLLLLLLADRCVGRLLLRRVGGRVPIVGVPADVFGEMVGPGECVIANRAGELLLAGVYPRVPCQLIWKFEGSLKKKNVIDTLKQPQDFFAIPACH